MTFEELSKEHTVLYNNYRNLEEELERTRTEKESLRRELAILSEQLRFLRTQMFGRKSERRAPKEDPHQEKLFEFAKEQEGEEEEAEFTEVSSHSRRKSRKNKESAEAPLGTFPENLPRVEVICDEKPKGVADEDLELEKEKTTERLAEKPSEQYVLKIVRKIYKVKSTGEFHAAPPLAHPFGRCQVDVSFLVMMVIKKFMWHLPLHRQWQMLKFEGINLNRGQMAEWAIRLAELYRPIVEVLEVILKQIGYLYLDETPTRVGRGEQKKGKVYEKGYFWPLMVPHLGIVFKFSRSRGEEGFQAAVGDYAGILITDALDVYERHLGQSKDKWQLCMMHSRRNFIAVESSNPAIADVALGYFRKLYEIEKEIKKNKLANPEEISLYRQEHSKPLLDEFKQWLKDTAATPEAMTDDNLSKAISYMLKRWDAVCLFVFDGRLSMDNGACERAIRPIKLGQNNWLFFASEVGAEAAAIFYSLIATCRLHGIHPYYYLLDVLNRIEQPGIAAEDLVPHRWKERFAEEAMPEHIYEVFQRFQKDITAVPEPVAPP